MSLIPVNTLRTANGQLVSLAALRGALDAKAIPLDDGTEIENATVVSGAVQFSVPAVDASSNWFHRSALGRAGKDTSGV